MDVEKLLPCIEFNQEYLLNLEKKVALVRERYAHKTELEKVEIEIVRIQTIREINKTKHSINRLVSLLKMNIGCHE